MSIVLNHDKAIKLLFVSDLKTEKRLAEWMKKMLNFKIRINNDQMMKE